MESPVTVARQFQSFIATIAEQRAIAHAEERDTLIQGEERDANNYARMEYVFIEVMNNALEYALSPEDTCTHTLNAIGLDMFAQFAANEILMQIQFFDQNDLTDASRRAWLIAFIEWAKCASRQQYEAVAKIREVAKAKALIHEMGVTRLRDM